MEGRVTESINFISDILILSPKIFFILDQKFSFLSQLL